MKDKLLLIDAYSIICRGFYALPLLSNEGKHTNALLGFLNILFRTIDEENPKYIAVAFDENAPTFRHKLYKEYKGQRKPMPAELKEQVPYVKEVLAAMGISIFSKVGYEADDILGSLAKKFESSKVEAVILSGDKDMLQLASDTTKIRHVKTAKGSSDIYPYYAKDVENEYHMTPKEFIDLKAIMGDPSDNIKGLSGIGKITANDLIVKYKSIENIYDHLAEITKKSVVKAFTEEKEDLKLYKKLVTIVTDVDIDKDLSDLSIKDIYGEKAYEAIMKYNLKSLYKKFNKDAKVEVKKKASAIDDDENLAFAKGELHEDDHKTIAYDMKNRLKKGDKVKDDLTIMSYLINPLKKDYEDIRYEDQEKCYERLHKKLEELDLLKVYKDIELPLAHVLAHMEEEGIAVDTKLINNFSKTLSKEIDKLTLEIHKLAGEEFNINSPKQLSDILFNKLSLTYERKKNEKLSTSVEVLQKLLDKHPIIEKIMTYRTYNKLLTTYADALPKYIVDGRIHTNFNQTETATGRLSSDNPNLQNIPIRTKLGRELRKAFIPREGYTFIDADYSQIELRVLAILSDDKNLIEAYKGKTDVHSATASEVFNVPLDKITPELRRKAKAINFGIVYGISSYGLSEGLNIDTHEAKNYIDKYFERYSKVKEYLDKTVEAAKANAYTKTYYGRIRPIPEFITGNAMQKAFAKRVAMNSPIQGTAADIMKLAMIRVSDAFAKEKLDSHIVLQVHDEILVETKIGEEEKVKKILKEAMTDSFDFPVELKIDINVGNNWDEAH